MEEFTKATYRGQFLYFGLKLASVVVDVPGQQL